MPQQTGPMTHASASCAAQHSQPSCDVTIAASVGGVYANTAQTMSLPQCLDTTESPCAFAITAMNDPCNQCVEVPHQSKAHYRDDSLASGVKSQCRAIPMWESRGSLRVSSNLTNIPESLVRHSQKILERSCSRYRTGSQYRLKS